MSSSILAVVSKASITVTSTQERASIFKQPKAVWAVFFTCIIAFMGIGLVDPILPALAKNLHASPSNVSLQSTASAAYSFMRFIGGVIAPFLASKLAEWYNPHIPFIVGAVVVSLSALFIRLNNKHVKHIDHVESTH